MSRCATIYPMAVTRANFLDGYLPFLLHKSYRLISADFHASLDELGVDLPECRILEAVHDFGSATLQQIAGRAALTQPTTSRVCARLVGNGLLTRQVGEGDRRSRVFGLTRQGKSLSERLMSEAEASVDRVMSTLSVDGDDLKAMLLRIVAELEDAQAGRRLASGSGVT